MTLNLLKRNTGGIINKIIFLTKSIIVKKWRF